MAVVTGPATEIFPILESQLTVLVSLFGLAPTITGGGAVAARTLSLPRNGSVASDFPCTLRVVHAEWFAARDVAQLRQGGPDGTAVTVVIDFGAARTVGAVASTSSAVIVTSVRRWLGASFEDAVLVNRSAAGAPGAFASEVRTERLLVTCTAASFALARAALAVRLPELPADLELRIDGGSPIWLSPGTVSTGSVASAAAPPRLATGAIVNGAQRWQLAAATTAGGAPTFEQTVDLAPALDALMNDPDAAHGDRREVTIALSSRVPGAIGLDLPESPHARLRHVARVSDGFTEGRRDVTFSSEEMQVVPLAVPAWATAVHSATCVLAGSTDASRTLPPIGPDGSTLAPSLAKGGVARPDAEFVIDSARSLALRIPAAHGLLLLTSVRVPLRPESSGCELRAVLLSAAGDPLAPAGPIDGGAGTPVVVEPASDGNERWVTLPLQSPFTLAADTELFVALHVVRGEASLAATRLPGGAAADGSVGQPTAAVPEGAVEVWRGPPTGPWALVPDSADLRGLRGRLRLTGSAPPDRPIAPLRAALGRVPAGGDGVSVGPKGGGVQLTATGASGPVALHLVALTACTITVRDVVVTLSAAPTA